MPGTIQIVDKYATNWWNIDSEGYGQVKLSYVDENNSIINSDDAVTTVNYDDVNKDSVSSIVTSSVSLGRKVTDTYDNSGGTTLVISRVVSDV